MCEQLCKHVIKMRVINEIRGEQYMFDPNNLRLTVPAQG